MVIAILAWVKNNTMAHVKLGELVKTRCAICV